MAFVRGVMAFSISGTSMLKLSAAMSTNTGTAFAMSTGIEVPMKVWAGTMTSSPGPMSSAARARWRAVTPLQVARAKRAPKAAAYLSSNSFTVGPVTDVMRPSSSTAARSALSFSVNSGHFGQGVVRTGVPPSSARRALMIPPCP